MNWAGQANVWKKSHKVTDKIHRGVPEVGGPQSSSTKKKGTMEDRPATWTKRGGGGFGFLHRAERKKFSRGGEPGGGDHICERKKVSQKRLRGRGPETSRSKTFGKMPRKEHQKKRKKKNKAR